MTTDATDPIQELLIAARRAQILDAATRVFAEKGLHRATIKDVARAAGVADGTIYNYFANKDALLLGILDRVNQSQQRAAAFAQVPDLAQFIRSYTAQRLAHLSESNLDVLRVLLSELLVNPQLAERYVAQIIAPTFAVADAPFAAWAASGAIHSQDSQLATRAMAGTVLGLLVLRLLGDDYLEAHWNQVPAVVADLMLHGLGVQEGATDEPRSADQSGEPAVSG